MSNAHSTEVSRDIVFRAPFADVIKNNSTGQQQLSASKAFAAGEVICDFGAGEITDTATYLTVQLGVDRHITLKPDFLQYINHGCDPNLFFDTTTMKLVALKPIAAGDEFRFFYPSTEWEMAQPFLCQCGAANCLQLIQGASFLSTETLSQYRLTDFIQQQLLQKVKTATV